MGVWARVNDVINVNMPFTVGTKKGEIVLSYILTGANLEDQNMSRFAIEATNKFVAIGQSPTSIRQNIRDIAANGWTMGGCTLTNMTIKPTPYKLVIEAPPVIGLRAGECLPANSALLIRKRTNGPSRSGQGRTYLGGMSEVDQTTGQWLVEPPFTGGVQNVITALQASLTYVDVQGVTRGLIPVVWSRKLGGWNPIQAMNWDPKVATQRRRQGKFRALPF